MEGSVLVIGGGIAGIQVSLDLTEMGFKVYLIEKKPSIGGHMAQFDKLYPEHDCSLCTLAPKMVAIYKNPNIELFTLSEVVKVTGTAGNFEVFIKKHPRFIEEDKCRGCGDCAARCPKIEAPNYFDMDLGKRKSVYIPFPQAIPPVYLIDSELCLYLNRNVCGVCNKVCKAKAINFDDEIKNIKLKVGAIVVATGLEMMSQELSPKWGYQFKNVINALEYERILCPTGPFSSKILRLSDEIPPKKVAFIQCVGYNEPEEKISYCSRVCCMYTAKQAILTKIYNDDIDVSVFRHKIRIFGRNFYEYTSRAEKEYDIKYLQANIKYLEEEPDSKNIIIHYTDLKTKIDKTFEADLVVLAAPLMSAKSNHNLAKILGLKLDKFNFFKSKTYFDNSISPKKGIFLCGFCIEPMDIPEVVSQASGVAGQVAMLLKDLKYSKTRERETSILPEEEIIKITPRALIIGGGVSGMTAALNISSQGYETILIEKDSKLGGNLNNINVLSPINIKASEFIADLEKKIKNYPKIKVFLNSEISNIEGSIGNYKITFIDENKLEKEFDVGVIILATGAKEYKPMGQFNYDGKNENVITLLELEQKLKNENISWINGLKYVTFILCVRSRQKDGFSYCSNVCCSNTIKNINLLKKINPKLEILVVHRDLHVAKKELEELFNKRKNLAKYLHYNLKNIPNITRLSNEPEKYKIVLKDDYNPEKIIDFNIDLVVLATPLIPPEDNLKFSRLLNIPLDDNNFFIEAHKKLRPLDFKEQEVFICGCAQWPKKVQECISQANGAAGRASRFLSIGQISSTRLKFLSFILSMQCFFKDVIVNPEKCNGCGSCVEACSFKAIELIDARQDFEEVRLLAKKAFINPALCKGCGKCASICKLKAIDARHFDFNQISSIIEPYFLEKVKSKESLKSESEVFISN